MMGRITKRAGILIATFVVFGIVSAAHAAVLSNPPRSEFGCELSDNKALKGISVGLISRGWTIVSKESGKMVAQVIVRGKHTLVVDITYDKKSFEIQYKSSENLKYSVKDDGTKIIHRNANKWMGTVQQDIAKELVGLCFE